MTIARDDDVLGGEPRIEGTRVGVRHVTARVIDRGRAPAYVADQLDVGLSEVYEALSYYYAHVDEMRELEQEKRGGVRARPGVVAEAERDGSVTAVRIVPTELRIDSWPLARALTTSPGKHPKVNFPPVV